MDHLQSNDFLSREMWASDHADAVASCDGAAVE